MLNRAPDEVTIDDLARRFSEGPHCEIDGKWMPCRAYGYFGLRSRIRLAWAVFTGRADALFWPGQDLKAY